MKLTTRKLKQMINQELKNLNENLDYKNVGTIALASPAIVLAGLGIYDIADQSMLDREQLIQDVQMLSVEEIQQNLENSEYFKNLNARRMRKKAAQNKSGFYDEFGIDHTQSSRPGDDKSFQIKVQSKEMAEKIKNLSPEELDQLLNIRALQNVLRYDMPKSDSAPLSIDHRGPFKENKMKLTTRKLKQMIREVMGLDKTPDPEMDKRTVKYNDLSSDAIATIKAVQSLNDEKIKVDNNGIYYSERVTPPIIIVWAGPRGSEPSHSNVLATINSRGGMSVVRNIRHLDLVDKLTSLKNNM